MRKKSIKKLSLQKKSISVLNASVLSGGTAEQSKFEFCRSVNICETRDYTRCNGELYCQIYL